MRAMPFLVAFSAFCACSAPPATPPAAPASAASDVPAPSGAPAAPAAPATATSDDMPPSATITGVLGSAEATAYMKVTAVFKNPSSRPCKLRRYTLVWSGGQKEIKLDDFSVPAGESRERTVRVHPEDGDLKTLTMQSARVELP